MQLVSFLGHVVSDEYVLTDPEKVSDVREWHRLRLRTPRSFLGLCSNYQQFVKGFASIASPLYRLTEKEGTFTWTEKCDVAFHGASSKL